MSRHLLVIGAQRCGTTYLHTLLEAHPQVTMARPARPEPKVFCSETDSARGVEWYDATYFAHATTQDVWGEKSTSYLEDPHAAQRARAVLGDPLVLVLLRDPVARAVSNWRFSRDHGLEDRPLETAFRDELAGHEPAWDRSRTSVSPFAYLARGRFADYLEPWLAVFPDLAVHLLADLVGHDDALGRLYAGLGVDATVRPVARHEKVNASSPGTGGPEDLDGGLPPLPEDLRADLAGWFAESDAALADLLGRPLPWRAPTTAESSR